MDIHPKRATRRRRTSSASRFAGGMGWSSAGGGAGRLGGAPAVPRAGVKRLRAGARRSRPALSEFTRAWSNGSWSQHIPAKAPHAWPTKDDRGDKYPETSISSQCAWRDATRTPHTLDVASEPAA